MRDKIRVLLVEDHGIVRNGLKLLLELDDKIEVCAEAETLNEAMITAERTYPDVILLDFKLPDGDGINGCINFKKRFPDIKIIILTAYSHDYMVMETIRAGADGYLLKNVESEELINAIIHVFEGGSILDPSVTNMVFDDIKINDEKREIHGILSPKEIKILNMISLGKTNKEIASALYISDKTVRNYVSNIFRKLNVSNRTEAAMYWIRGKMVE